MSIFILPDMHSNHWLLRKLLETVSRGKSIALAIGGRHEEAIPASAMRPV